VSFHARARERLLRRQALSGSHTTADGSPRVTGGKTRAPFRPTVENERTRDQTNGFPWKTTEREDSLARARVKDRSTPRAETKN